VTQHSAELTVLFLHLMARGRNRNKVFLDDQDRWEYLNLLSRHARSLGVRILAWALLSNHVHLLVECRDAASASELLRRVNGAHGRRFNSRHGRAGQVWATRPRKEPVCYAAHFRNCQLYIDLNPERADLADRAEEYEWSSCRHYVTGQVDGLTTRSPWFDELGGADDQRRAVYCALLEVARKRDWRPE